MFDSVFTGTFMVELRHREKTKELRGLLYKVRNELSSGWSEAVYHQALVHTLQASGIPVSSKPRRPFLHRGVQAYFFEPDLIVWDTIILELKALPYQKEFTGEQYAQLIHYLKFWKKDLGLLVNFSPLRMSIRRVVWDEPELDICEDYDRIVPHLSEQNKIDLRRIRQHILEIARQYGLGYPERLYRRLIAIEMDYHNLPCISDVGVMPIWEQHSLPRHTTSHLCIAGQYLIHVRSLLPNPTDYDFVATKTYLRNLGLNIGLVINFGQRQLQIHGVLAE